MSSTTNVQNLLSNVFRPTFTYDTTYSNYTSKLELVNIDTVSANAVTVYAVNVGDASGNVYVGILAGNANSNLALKLSVSNTFVGTSAGAGASNVSNSVFLGHSAGTGTVSSSNSISIGSFSVAGGNSNIYIGAGTGIATGSNNIFLGTGVRPASTANTLMIGNGVSNMAIIGALNGTSNRIGINYSPTTFSATSSFNALDINGFTRIGGPGSNGSLGINVGPGNYTLDVNGSMQVSDGSGRLIMSNDGNSNSVTTLSNVVANKTATLQVTGGFFSLTGSINVGNGATSNIGVLKKGIVIVSAHDPTSASNYASRMFTVTVSGASYAAASMANTTSNATVTNSGSNITLSNSTASPITFTYSITYFPSP